jgi:short-subunit dehydrogenase
MTGFETSGAVVTGAGRGLGRALAGMLADRGYAVHVTDVDLAAAKAAAAEIGHDAFASALDVRDAQACLAIAHATSERVGSLGLWVNNAGVLVTGPAWEQDENTRRLMMEVNGLGAMNGTLAALDVMRGQSSGHIVTIVSLAGLVAVPGMAVYAASKHAEIGFALSTLADLRLAGIRHIDISCVCPDGMWTPMLYDKLDDPQAALSFSGKLLEPEDVVKAVAKVLDKPKPVTTVPAWRGGQARVIDALPRVMVATTGLVRTHARRAQRKYKRRYAKEGRIH